VHLMVAISAIYGMKVTMRWLDGMKATIRCSAAPGRHGSIQGATHEALDTERAEEQAGEDEHQQVEAQW